MLPTTIIVMSFIYGLPALYSLFKDLKRKVWVDINVDNTVNSLPSIAIIVPFYREDRYSIAETFRSIANQIYPSDKISVYIILENGDEDTKKHVEELKKILYDVGIAVQIYVNTSRRSGKANAINCVLQDIINNGYVAVMILDGGDRITDRYYIYKCIELIRKGYNIIGAKVYRVGKGLLGKLSYIDTVLWCNVSFPGIHSVTKVPFLSGEGMVITTAFLRRIGKIPEVLAEDAYVAMLSFIYRERVVLINSIILEGAPATFRSLIKQRLRWYRGGLECLRDFIVRYRRSVAKADVIRACIAYTQTIALTAPAISLIVVILSLFITPPHYALTLAKIEIISLFISPLVLYLANDIKDPILFLAPLNWMLQSFIALLAMIPIRVQWYRTSARSMVEQRSGIPS